MKGKKGEIKKQPKQCIEALKIATGDENLSSVAKGLKKFKGRKVRLLVSC